MNKLFCRIFLGFMYLLQSTSLSLPWEIAHAYLQNPTFKNPFISKSLAKGVVQIHCIIPDLKKKDAKFGTMKSIINIDCQDQCCHN